MPEAGRVIAGSARGIRLEGAPHGTRPLADRVKQALFASLESDGVLGDGFLDLFAGTGAAGIEALSRGASRATFVERERAAAKLIETNLAKTGLIGSVFRSDVLRFLAEGSPQRDGPYGVVLIDPPYDDLLVEPTLALLGDSGLGWLEADAVVVAKHFWRDDPPERVATLRRTRQKRFGETMLSYYTRAE